MTCNCAVYDLSTDEVICAPTVDIDLHRFRCLVCGAIGYYSGRARAAHENGKDDHGINCYPTKGSRTQKRKAGKEKHMSGGKP